MMPQGKHPSSFVSQKTAAARSRALPYVVNRKTGPAMPIATTLGPTSALGQPGQTTTCIAYAFQPSQGQEAILLIPTTAFKVELRNQAGQKVLQLLPPSAPFVPFMKVVNRPAASATSVGTCATTHHCAAGASQQTAAMAAAMTAASSSAANEKPSNATSASIKMKTTRFQTCPASWENALRLDVDGKVLNGKCAVLPSGGKMALAKAPVVSSEDVREQIKQAAGVRYNRNDALFAEILDKRIVKVADEATGASDSSGPDCYVRWLTSKVQSAMLDAEQVQNAYKQKMNDIAEADGLFHYKMDRFKEVASVMNSVEFHKAEVEAELNRMSEMSM